jgi:hypothetical protein
MMGTVLERLAYGGGHYHGGGTTGKNEGNQHFSRRSIQEGTHYMVLVAIRLNLWLMTLDLFSGHTNMAVRKTFNKRS